MIYPTRAAVIAAVVGIPVALLVAAVEPGRWFLALAWPLAVLLLTAIDAFRGIATSTVRIEFPGHACVGEVQDVEVTVAVGSGPKSAEIALEGSPIVRLEGRLRVPLEGGRGAILVPMAMLRRGFARFEQLWVRWTGPLGLAWQQSELPLDRGFPVLPDLRPVHQQAAQIFQRQTFEGLLAQLNRGEGSDFNALVEFTPGMDRRSIDWKQSARHGKLLAKQYHSERNSHIVFAVDCGRQMCEPVAGLPRIDHCISAMLLAAWVALKLGDRVAINAFDSRPRLSSGLASGGGAFAELQRLAAGIDYSNEETNYTAALTSLSARLSRRSMVVLFTEFTDRISADFLLRALRRMVETHLVLIVVLRDEELESIAAREPDSADDVTRAITATSLLKERLVVITSLQHLGVHVVESEHDRVGERLVDAYINLKRRNRL